MIKRIKKLPFLKLVALAVLFFFYIFLYQIYSPRVSAFGCFDDCFNYVAGYFLLRGKILYSEIFFNHQPLMAYLSFLVQKFFQPINIYELVLRHRQLVFVFSFFMNALFVWRFSLVGLGFALFYETSKFYLFGDRFLAEGLAIYLLVYLAGLLWLKLNQKKIWTFEYIMAGFFTWLVVFLREPFIPLALLTYILLLGGRPATKAKKISLAIFTSLLVLILVILPMNEYFFNLVTVNLKTQRFVGIAPLKSLFYPLLIPFWRERNAFSDFLLGLDLIFLFLFLWLISHRSRSAMILFLLLGLANLRVGKPGRIFYDAFHLLPWYGIFIVLIFLILGDFYRQKRKIGLVLTAFLIFFVARFIFSPQFFAWERINPHQEFITNFGNELHVGEAVKKLSSPTDTLFLDGFDDLIYWQADRISPYKYFWYTSFMPNIQKFSQARLEMFASRPPDFYYGSCSDKEVPAWTMPEFVRNDYQQLYSLGKPTCLYVHKSKLPQISPESWKKARELLYELPSRNERGLRQKEY